MANSPNREKVKFSVIMPTFNRAGIICEAIESLLVQTYDNFELIIVDDGSTDDTEKVLFDKFEQEIKSEKIRYIKLGKNEGVSNARNVGLNAVKNEWVCYLDSDNRMYSDYLETFQKYIKKTDNLIYYAQMHQRIKQDTCGKKFSYNNLFIWNFIDMGVFVHHISLYEKYGGFDTSLKRLVDWDFILKYTKKQVPYFIEKIILDYNDSDKIGRITNSEAVDIKAFRKIINKIKIKHSSYIGFISRNVKMMLKCL